MKTSVIRYRVADFLREHSPFDLFSVEDLISFAGTGRVVFHEDDVFLAYKGEHREPALWIIQQGRVEIIDQTPAGEHLRDVLGPGDLVLPGSTSDASVNSHSVKTSTEVILYSFDANAFEVLVEKYPDARRFLTAHLSATARHTRSLQNLAVREALLTDKEKKSWLKGEALPLTVPRLKLVTCRPETPIREVAEVIADARGQTVVVVAADSRPLGLIADHDFREMVRSGHASTDITAETLMNRDLQTALPGRRSADYFLEMVKGRTRKLVITRDGSSQGSVEGIILDDDLAINCGRNPALIVRELLAAETVEELAYVRASWREFLAEELSGPSAVEWFWQMNGAINAILAEKTVQIAVAEMERAGRHSSAPFSLLFFGAAGRREKLTADTPAIGIAYEDRLESNDEARRYFSILLQKVVSKLEATSPGSCAESNGAPAGQDSSSRSLSKWKEFFAGLIRDPILNSIYAAREFFDFSVVYGAESPGEELRRFIVTELERSESFIPVLANDTLASLPPLTFFEGFAVEVDRLGVQRKTLDLEKMALTPIVDAARVFALSVSNVSDSSTIRRLECAAQKQPLVARIFADAMDSLHIAAFHHASARLREQGDYVRAPTSRLSRFEQRRLKTVFDAVRRLLELVTETSNQGSATI